MERASEARTWGKLICTTQSQRGMWHVADAWEGPKLRTLGDVDFTYAGKGGEGGVRNFQGEEGGARRKQGVVEGCRQTVALRVAAGGQEHKVSRKVTIRFGAGPD